MNRLPDPATYATEDEVCERFGVHRRTLWRKRCAGEIQFYRFGKRIAYRRDQFPQIERLFLNNAPEVEAG